MNLTHVWFDSFTKQKKLSMSPTLDALSSLFNYAVACARIVSSPSPQWQACYMDLSGDGIKEASKLFQQAAWTFEHLRSLSTNLNPSEVSVDFTAESLGMLSNLMLAQAQYLFYKKALDAGMKPGVLAKIAMQVAEYFRKAYELSQTNAALKTYDSGKFANVQLYHSIYFKAMAYFVLAQEQYKRVDEQANGMGLAVGYFKAVIAQLDEAKKVVGLIPSNYQDNFNAKYSDIAALRDKAVKDNKSIYFERETPVDQIPKPDCQNFVKLEAALESIQTKLPVEDKLRHIVPPEVRAMQNDLKNQLQELISQQYEQEGKADAELRKFLQGFGLPQALHAATATTEVPPQVWAKIEDFQKKGGLQNVQGMIQGVGAMRANNQGVMQQMMQTLEEEERLDSQMRQQYQQKWNRLPSSALNGQFKHAISDLTAKALVAAETDGKLEQKFQEQGPSLQLLQKTKNELSAMIPQTAGQREISENAAVVALRQALEGLDHAKEGKAKVFEEAVQKCQNFNAVEQLLLVHQGQAEKGLVFEGFKKEFRQLFAQLEPFEKQVAELKS